MRKFIACTTLLLLTLAESAQAVPATQCAVVLKDANVWDGAGFKKRDLAISAGQFVSVPVTGSSEIEASWLWITPPMADAHTHMVDEPKSSNDPTHRAAIRRGIFYALNPNNILTGKPIPTGPWVVDSVYAGGGLTKPGGDPRPLYDQLASSGQLGGLRASDLPGRAFHEVTDDASARAAVRAVKATGTSVIKLFLVDHDTANSKGLSAESFRAAVDEARKQGLRPIVHVDSGSDFRLAVAERVYAILHMPGALIEKGRPASDYLLAPEDARQAAKANIAVVPTVSLAFFYGPRAELALAQSIQARNLDTLRSANVTLAVGADTTGRTAIDELNLLRTSTKIGDDALLNMATTNGARLIFPDRKVGQLESGWEASFLGYFSDPRSSWYLIGQPFIGVRQGEVLFDGANLLSRGCAPPSS